MEKKYSSRERCIRAITRQEIDFIPLNIWINAPEPLDSLMNFLGIKDRNKLLSHLRIDYRGSSPNLNMVSIGLSGGYEEKKIKDGNGRAAFRNRFGIITALSSDGKTRMHVNHPLDNIELEDFPWVTVDEDSVNEVIRMRKKYESYCMMGYTLQPFETACALFGYTETFKRIFSQDKKFEKTLDKLLDITISQTKLLLEAGVDEIYNGDDVGAENTMIISPQLWRRYLGPRYKTLADLIHKKASYFHFHSDGWIEPIIPDLIKLGVDVLEPIQPESMNPRKIKDEYGDRISFEGAISIQRTLPFGSQKDVEDEVKTRIRDLGPTGYILRPSHTILERTPIENIVKLYETAVISREKSPEFERKKSV